MLLPLHMHIFHCDHCEQLVFFENVRCVACGHALAYLPDVGDVGTLEPVGGETWRRTGSPDTRSYRLCTNYDRENVCNWAVPADDPQTLCQSCRRVRVFPTSVGTVTRGTAWRSPSIA